MRDIIENITILQRKINELQAENKILKQILSNSNIEYKSKLKLKSDIVSNSYENNKEVLIKEINADVETANKFYSMFWGRQDVYAKRYFNKNTGKKWILSSMLKLLEKWLQED